MPGELKPCPFCGSTNLRTMRGVGYRNHTMVKCEGCGARSGCYLREDNCHSQWNRRDDIVEALDTSTNSASLTCTGCKYLRGRHCLLSANHCSRAAEDMYTAGE